MFKSIFKTNGEKKAQIIEKIKTFLLEFDAEFILSQCEFVAASDKDPELISKLILPFKFDALKAELEQTFDKLTIEYQLQLASLSKLHHNKLAQIKHVVAVASGKGGVGKSTTTVNIARSLASFGAKVGVLDADIYGPSIPLMFGLQGQQPDTHDGKIMQPLVSDEGIKCNSIGFLVDPNDAAIWRGPMASRALTQLFNETQWGELDYLLIDLPPGTGDIQLTLTQSLPLSGAIVVTTPQNIALADAKKAIAMFNKVNVAVLGLIENMSLHVCSQCGHVEHIFGCDGGKSLAAKEGVNVLGMTALDINLREIMDNGDTNGFKQASFFRDYQKISLKLANELYTLAQARPASQSIEITQLD
ncbi:iron-sulfur cluster carrier protein ApbC [Catenovulum sp. 2E275]|nr:iron-sulfur cluster carrier protein ApbC [Catenovulum sp. 2E275]